MRIKTVASTLLQTLVVGLSATIAVQGSCDTDTLFFGDLDPEEVTSQQLQLVSAVGVYVRETNNVSLTAFRHTGRPDIFLLAEPTEVSEGETRRWVVATLPDDKKPTQVEHAFEAWPAANNILALGEFASDPWVDGDGRANWMVRDCNRQGWTPLKNLSLTCVPPQFGQCHTGKWLVNSDRHLVLNGVFSRDQGRYKNGRPVYSGDMATMSVGSDGRWHIKHQLKDVIDDEIVSSTSAERLEFVQRWMQRDTTTNELETNLAIEVRCLPENITRTDPCSPNPCKNNGTCIAASSSEDAEGGSAYFCRCPFDSRSKNCEQVRECKPPPRVANGELLFTTDLALDGKAFYICDVAYYIQDSEAKDLKRRSTFATCDGSEWKNIPRCSPVSSRVTIANAYVHHCDFDSGWCPGYVYGPRLTLSGATLPWRRDFDNRQQSSVAEVDISGFEFGQEQRVARLQTACMFVPTEGCVAFDLEMGGAGPFTLSVLDNDDVILWKTSERTDWTTATLTLPPGGNKLIFEAVVKSANSKVAIDNIRVFQWSCKEAGKLLFPTRTTNGTSGTGGWLALVTSVLLLLHFISSAQ